MHTHQQKEGQFHQKIGVGVVLVHLGSGELKPHRHPVDEADLLPAADITPSVTDTSVMAHPQNPQIGHQDQP